jgi:hypothetical protein
MSFFRSILSARFDAQRRVPEAVRSNSTRGLASVVVLALIGLPTTSFSQTSFKRGDVDGDGCVGGTDFALFKAAFSQDITTLGVPCEDAYDFNDDGSPLISILDFIAFAAALDNFGSLPAPGGVDCGPDPTADGLTCATYSGCANECDPSACIEADVGGTINLPPEGALCEYLTETDVHMIIDGLPPGTEVKVGVVHGGFTAISRSAGGVLSGEIEEFDSTVRLEMEGTGILAGFSRVIELAAPTEIHTAPPIGSGDNQLIEADMRSVQGSLAGDPDFQSLTVTAGTDHGLPSPGGTLLEPTGANFDVDSGFSVTYEISVVGAAGGPLAGMTGTTQGEAVLSLPVAPLVPSISNWGFAILIGSLLVLAMAALGWFMSASQTAESRGVSHYE